jgi:hypothetical protein
MFKPPSSIAQHRANGAHRRLAWTRPGLALLVVTMLLGVPAAGWAQPQAPAAQQPQPITLLARAGFDGYYKENHWLPTRVMVANDGPDVRGSLEVTFTRPNGSHLTIARQVELPTQSRREIFLYLPHESFFSSLTVRLMDGRMELAATTARVSQAGANDLIFGVAAGSPSVFNVLADVDPVTGSAHVAQLELADLPPLSSAWQALDVLVISDVDTGTLSADQRAALAGWVAAGGRLIVTGGPAWQRTASGLADLLPLRPTGTRTLADAAALGSFAAAEAPQGGGVAAVGNLTEDALTLAGSADVPLIALRRSGYGEVIYLAFDPAFEPLRAWDGLEGLFRNVLAGGNERPGWAGGIRNWYPARDAVNALPGLEFPSALLVCGFLGIYLMAVGPANYLVLKRMKRRELAWVTIPAIVLVFSLGAYVTGYQMRGAQAVLHRLSVVQVWPDSEYARVDQAIGLFSPRRTDYSLTFAEGFLARPMPIDAYGPGGTSYTVQQADQSTISEVRVDIGGLEPFVMQGQVAAPRFEADVAITVSGGTAELRGTVTNHSELALTDVVVLAPGGVAQLGDLAPGASLNIHVALRNARATAAPANTILPAAAAGVGPNVPFYSMPSSYDSTIDDILGGRNYYNDRAQYRRYALLSSIIDTYGGGSRGSGVFLVGWADHAPAGIQLANRVFTPQDLSVYIVNLRPRFDLTGNVVAIPPGLMSWMAIGPARGGGPASPYDMYLYQGTEYTLRFAPALAIDYAAPQSLTLHLASYGLSGPAGVNVELWDYEQGAWLLQSVLNWGDNQIAAPQQHVGPGGEIQVRVTNAGQPQVSLERLDFTLVVER